MVEDIAMSANLILLDIVDFDVVPDADWSQYNRTDIDYYGN